MRIRWDEYDIITLSRSNFAHLVKIGPFWPKEPISTKSDRFDLLRVISKTRKSQIFWARILLAANLGGMHTKPSVISARPLAGRENRLLHLQYSRKNCRKITIFPKNYMNNAIFLIFFYKNGTFGVFTLICSINSRAFHQKTSNFWIAIFWSQKLWKNLQKIIFDEKCYLSGRTLDFVFLSDADFHRVLSV